MTPFTKKPFLVVAAVLGIGGLGLHAYIGCPSLWAVDFAVDPAANAHLAERSGLSPSDAAMEAIHWDVSPGERIPSDRVSISVDESGSDFVVQITYPAQDDSYGRMFYEVTLTRSSTTWAVTRLRRCWTGRGLSGWSTGIPS
jgi:hypothetical protein